MKRFWVTSVVATVVTLVLGSGSLAREPSPAPPQASKRAAPASDDSLVEVVATGIGNDKEAARKDALREAVAQVVGALVIARAEVNNDELIASKILTYSDGFVEKYVPEGEPTQEGYKTKVTIRAWVRTRKLSEALASNSITVRKNVDLRSLHGQSETLADRARSAVQVVQEAFDGVPTRFLIAEPLAPIRISGDAEATLVEVPVRVTVDGKAWKEWATNLSMLLDPIAEAHGTDNWNFAQSPWKPLTGKFTNSNGAAVTTSDLYHMQRFMPKSVQGKGYHTNSPLWLGGLPKGVTPVELKAARENVRFVGVMDSVGGRVHWWRLPPDAWAALTSRTGAVPELQVSMVDGEGDAVGASVTSWEERTAVSKPGETASEVVSGYAGIGTPFLYYSDRYFTLTLACSALHHQRCLMREDSKWQQSRQWHSGSDEYGVLFHPSVWLATDTGEDRRSTQRVVNPSAIFPFRFEIPASVANSSTQVVRCEFVGAASRTGSAGSDK